jgi:hypothetical protein
MFEPGLSFSISHENELIIPQLDVSKCNIEMFTPDTLNEWKTFCKSFSGEFATVLKNIRLRKYKTEDVKRLLIKIPYNYTGCIWENYPDLYNCDGEQVLAYLEKTRSKLSTVQIKSTQFQTVINCNITPETFLNLSIHDYSRLSRILIDNGETSTIIWCSVACWWNYFTEVTAQSYVQTGVVDSGTERWVERWANQKIEHQKDTDNTDEWIYVLNEFCCPKLYTRCNWFLMIHARAIANKSIQLLNWIDEHKMHIVWDADLLSDTPSYAFNQCYQQYDNEYISAELKKRFI